MSTIDLPKNLREKFDKRVKDESELIATDAYQGVKRQKPMSVGDWIKFKKQSKG